MRALKRVTLWTSIAAALYILSVAPLGELIGRYSSGHSILPGIYDLYATPYVWAAAYTPFMEPYEVWWRDWADSK